MNHESLREKIFALYDGELDAKGEAEAKAHLNACEECAALYKRWQNVSKAFFNAPKPETSEFFVRQVMNKIKVSEKPEPVLGRNILWRVLVPVFGVSLIFLMQMGPVEYPASMEAMMMGNTPENGVSKIFSQNTLTLDDTLTMIMEEPS